VGRGNRAKFVFRGRFKGGEKEGEMENKGAEVKAGATCTFTRLAQLSGDRVVPFSLHATIIRSTRVLHAMRNCIGKT
jgi:hypothetical protein